MAERDQRDSERAHAPLRRADNAIVVDTTTLSLDEVVHLLLQHVTAVRKC
jgi:cytidylate kinase